MAEVKILQKQLPVLDPNAAHTFIVPQKTINDGSDVSFFLTSTAYRDIWSFIFQLNASMFPQQLEDTRKPRVVELTSTDIDYPASVQQLGDLIKELGKVIDEVPPDTGPRRFGNISFRRWYEIVEQRLSDLLDQYLPADVLTFGSPAEGAVTAKDELKAYLYGSFGSAQRLDYGTGHELSFLAFLACIWKLGGFPTSSSGEVERAIVLGVIEPYLQLIRRLILTYTLEPAGSHGVWGLDDHSFIPYILGSAQLSPPISFPPIDIPTEGSLPGSPSPADVAKKPTVDRERKTNMYFSAIGFINDVKKGPFWEHSPILYDVSGVTAGWAKINKGMIKMYNAEVLSKFPVVQHFPFGSLFRWERDPESRSTAPTVHTQSQPLRAPPQSTPQGLRDPLKEEAGTGAPWASGKIPASTGAGTAAPWASNPPSTSAVTAAPWASNTPSIAAATTAPWTPIAGRAPQPLSNPPSSMQPTPAPFRNPNLATRQFAPSLSASGPGSGRMPGSIPTKASWVKTEGNAQDDVKKEDPAKGSGWETTKAPWA